MAVRVRGLNTFERGNAQSDPDKKDPEDQRTAGSFQKDAFQGHHHRFRFEEHAEKGSGMATVNFLGYGDENDRAVTIPIADGSNGAPRTSNETRPKNVALYFYIKIN